MTITDYDADAAAIAEFYGDLRAAYAAAHTGRNHPSNPTWTPQPEPAYTVEDGGSYPNGHERYAAAGIAFHRA